MVAVRELSRPIRPVALRDEGSAPVTLEELGLRSICSELSRQMERHQVEVKGQLQKLEDLIVRSGSLLADVPGGSRNLGGLVGNGALGGGGCGSADDKGLSVPFFTETVAGDNDLPAIAEGTDNISHQKISEEAAAAFPSCDREDDPYSGYRDEHDDDEIIAPKMSSRPSQVHQSTMLSTNTSKFSSLGAMRYQNNCCARLVADARFDHACAILIIASSLMVGVEVQYKTDENAFTLDLFGYVFVFCFSLELLVRVRARGLRKYFNGVDYAWSLFDVFCVSSSYLELIVSTVQSGSSGGSFLLVVRTLRVVRIARIIRVIRFLGKLRTMVYTMLGAMKMLGWAVLLLGMVMYMFSVVFTEAVKPLLQGTQQVTSDNREQVLSRGKEFFGDLYISMLTLMESITGGISWHEPLTVLKSVSALYVFMFLFYICVTILTIMNVITGLCCDYAIQNAVTDRADVIKQQIGLKDRWKSQFATIFKAMDEDGSGEVTSEELRHQLQEEEFQAYLMHLNISVDDAMELLEVLDSDHDGSISLEEFVAGCMRVKGQAKTIDLMKIMRECTLVRMSIDKKFAEMDEKLTQMRHL